MANSHLVVGQGIATIKHYPLEQVLQITSQTTNERMEKAYLDAGAEYTLKLAQERMGNGAWMHTVRKHFRQIRKETRARWILEMGPGVEDILYQSVLDKDGENLRWTAFDIIPEVVDTIKKRFGERGNYSAILGNARFLSLDVPGQYDLFVGMDTLDSVVAFPGIAREIRSKRIPWVVHIQYNIPPIEVLAYLIKNDSRFRQIEIISLVAQGENLSLLKPFGETGWTHIAVPTGDGLIWMQTNEYLHTRIAEEFSLAGFRHRSSGFVPYQHGDGSDALVSINHLLRLTKNPIQVNGLPTECTYHYLMMRMD